MKNCVFTKGTGAAKLVIGQNQRLCQFERRAFWMYGQTDGWTNIQTDGQTDRWTNRHTGVWTDRQTNALMDG